MAYGEDDNRVRKDNAPENMAMLRHLALTLLKADTTTKVGIQTRRKKAGGAERDPAHLPRRAKRKPAAPRMKMRFPWGRCPAVSCMSAPPGRQVLVEGTFVPRQSLPGSGKRRDVSFSAAARGRRGEGVWIFWR